MPILGKLTRMRFVTDDSLAYKGFWLKVSTRSACKDDWQLVGNQCLKVFTSEQLDWRSANLKCLQMNANLLKIDDVVADLKLTQYMNSFYPEVNSYWIGLRKLLDEFNQEKWTWSTNSTLYNDVSWWPWRKSSSSSSSSSNNCVMKKKNEDGYFMTSCDSGNKNSFICQTNTVDPFVVDLDAEVKLECGRTSEIDEILRKEMLLAEAVAAVTAKKRVESIVLAAADIDSGIGVNSINNVVVTSAASILANNKQFRTSKKSSYAASSGEIKMSQKYSETKTTVGSSGNGNVVVRATSESGQRLNTSK